MRSGWLLAIAGMALWAGACVPSKAEVKKAEVEEGTSIEVMAAAAGVLVELGNYSGKVEPRRSVVVSAEIPGKVKKVHVDEGDRVAPGAPLLVLDDEPYRLGESQAEQGVAAAAVRVGQLETVISMEKLQLEAGVEQAKAALDMALARQRIVENGARPEEKRQARAGREAARAAMDNARLDLERAKSLYENDAATRQQLDGANAAHDASAARFEQARAVYRLSVKGAREEDKESAIAAVEQARAAVKRSEAAVESLKVREKELEAARVQAKTADLSLENATYNRGKAKISSPMEVEAVVSLRNIDEGEMAAPGVPLLELLDLQRPRLILDIPGVDVVYLKKGDKVPVLCVGESKKRLGTVAYVSVKAHPKNTTFPVEVELDNSSGALRVGQVCEAFPELRRHREVLLPRDVVLDTEEGKVVMVVEDGVARERSVKLAAVRQGVAAVTEGVKAGDKVLVVGQRLVRDGEKVLVRGEHESVTAAGGDEAK